MSFDKPRPQVPKTTPSKPSGTTKITDSGIVQLSYNAAKHKNTAKIENAYKIADCEPEACSSFDWPVHSKPKPSGSLAANCAISAIASPLL